MVTDLVLLCAGAFFAGLVDAMGSVFGRQLYPNQTAALAKAKLFADLPVAYQYLTGVSANATEIFKQTLTINAMSQAMHSMAATSGAAFVWSVWMPAWRPWLEAGERYGVDVSAHAVADIAATAGGISVAVGAATGVGVGVSVGLSAARNTSAGRRRPTSSSTPTLWCSCARACRNTDGSTLSRSDAASDSLR